MSERPSHASGQKARSVRRKKRAKVFYGNPKKQSGRATAVSTSVSTFSAFTTSTIHIASVPTTTTTPPTSDVPTPVPCASRKKLAFSRAEFQSQPLSQDFSQDYHLIKMSKHGECNEPSSVFLWLTCDCEGRQMCEEGFSVEH